MTDRELALSVLEARITNAPATGSYVSWNPAARLAAAEALIDDAGANQGPRQSADTKELVRAELRAGLAGDRGYEPLHRVQACKLLLRIASWDPPIGDAQ